uniref:Uncharacterized protein n=1 Tax=Caenorhabditis japonica TaxID=281687 RepID=A0A8R1DMZ4_CAEJA
MQFSVLALLLLAIPFAVFAASPFAADEDNTELLNNNDRFARDLELRKKFAFAFAKRGGDDVLIEARAQPSAQEAGMRFAFAKRHSPKEFARFARASFA